MVFITCSKGKMEQNNCGVPIMQHGDVQISTVLCCRVHWKYCLEGKTHSIELNTHFYTDTHSHLCVLVEIWRKQTSSEGGWIRSIDKHPCPSFFQRYISNLDGEKIINITTNGSKILSCEEISSETCSS